MRFIVILLSYCNLCFFMNKGGNVVLHVMRNFASKESFRTNDGMQKDPHYDIEFFLFLILNIMLHF